MNDTSSWDANGAPAPLTFEDVEAHGTLPPGLDPGPNAPPRVIEFCRALAAIGCASMENIEVDLADWPKSWKLKGITPAAVEPAPLEAVDAAPSQMVVAP